MRALQEMPLLFIENRGQADPRVAYYVQGRDAALYFTATGVTYALAGQHPTGALPLPAQPEHPVPAPVVAWQNGVTLHFRLNHYKTGNCGLW